MRTEKETFEVNSSFTQGAEVVTLFNFDMNMFYKNREAHICQILRIF